MTEIENETNRNVPIRKETKTNGTVEKKETKRKREKRKRSNSKEIKLKRIKRTNKMSTTRKDCRIMTKRCRKKKIFQYGNYDRYYGYRANGVEGSEESADPRLKMFSNEWFEGKCCLDVGCNVGSLTMSIARLFSPKLILGVDIDHGLIKRAQRSLRKSRSSEEIKSPKENKTTSTAHEKEKKQKENCSVFPHNTQFRCANFVAADDCDDRNKGTYDTVLCLSVSKWIHLNWGDEGIRRLFRKIYDLLAPGGIFLFEPQPWKSYRKKYNLTERTKANFRSIALRPSSFDEFLTKNIGFRSVRLLGKPKHTTKGFGRSLYIYKK